MTISDNKFEELAQINHLLTGILLTTLSILYIGPKYIWYYVGSGVLLAAIKEFWYDQNYESVEERGSNWLDFGFYCLGIGIAIGLYYLVLGNTYGRYWCIKPE